MKKVTAHVSIQVLPKTDKGTDDLLRIVDEVITYIKSTGLNYFVGPTETAIEGDFDTLCEIVKNCQKICIESGANSVSTYVKYNYSPIEGVLTIERKTSKYNK